MTQIIPNGFQRLNGSHKIPLKGASIVSEPNSSEKVSVSIHLRRGSNASGASGIPDLKHWSEHSPLKQKPLTQEELGKMAGASVDDIKAVENYLTSKGLLIVSSEAAKRSIIAEGSVAQVQEAFSVSLHNYSLGAKTYRGREGFIHVPNNLSEIIKGVFGLDNRPVAHRNAQGNPPPDTNVLTPPKVSNLYAFPTGVDASTQTVGILEFGGGYNAGDINDYCNGLGIATPVLKSVGIGTAVNAPAGNISNVTYDDPDFEVVLDMEVIATVAPGVNIVVYFAQNTDDGWINAFKSAVYDTENNPSVFSVSWGGTETDWTQQSINALNEVFQEAASLHKTFFISSGDDGSDDRQNKKQAFVEYPACDPYVTGCGGTVISNVNGASFNEEVWNDAGASGGGISTVFTDVPAWQKLVSLPPSANAGAGPGRGVPDIAGNASPYSGYYLSIYGKSTENLIITSGDGKGSAYGSEGGTSAVAPLYAGMTALLNAALGKPVGYFNPTLYSLAGKNVFNQITIGNNAFNGAPGYNAGPGWNACTGLGSINGNNLLAALKEIANS
jgi:kumamolisin